MSQWPSDHRYVIPVAPGEDVVTVTIDGKEVQAPRGELLIQVAQQHGTYIPRFCWHERMKPVGMCRMCLVEVEGMRGLQISCATPVADGMVVSTQSPDGEDRAGRRARVPAHQPPARLPGVRPRRRVPAPGPDARVRSGRVALRRGEAALREADRDQRHRAARPRALHPVRPLHAVRGRGRRRPADRLRRPRRQHRGHHLPRRAVHVVLLRQHRADLPGRRAHRAPVPLPGPAVGPRERRDVVPAVRGRVPRRARVHVEPARAPARRRLRAGEPGLAVRPRPLRRSSGCTRPSARAGAARSGAAACSSRRRGPRRSTPRPTRCARALDARRSRCDRACSAVRAAPTKTRTCGRASPRACSGPTTSTRSSATDSRPRSCSACPRATIADLDRAAAIVRARARPQGRAPGPVPAGPPGRGRPGVPLVDVARARQRPHAVRHRRSSRHLPGEGRAVARRQARIARRCAAIDGRGRRRRARPAVGRRARRPRRCTPRVAARGAAERHASSPRSAAATCTARSTSGSRRASCPAGSPSKPAQRTLLEHWGGVPDDAGSTPTGILAAAAGGQDPHARAPRLPTRSPTSPTARSPSARSTRSST